MALVSGTRSPMRAGQYAALALVAVGLLGFLVSWMGQTPVLPWWVMTSLLATGIIGFALSLHRAHEAPQRMPGMLRSLTNRSAWAWILAVLLSGFYVCLYWYPQTLAGLIAMFDPLSHTLRKSPADHWFVYGALYTLAVLVMGVKFILKHRRNRYQVIRTVSVMFFQLVLAFLLPGFMRMLDAPEYYFTYFWPLKYEYLFPQTIGWLLESGPGLGVFLAVWGGVASFILVPVLTYFFGKRWYCSWVCGCGGLAETAGDAFRSLSDKSLRAWRIERWMVHGVLVFVVLTTALLWVNSWQQGSILGALSGPFAKTYGFLIGAVFSGVVGTGFYPLFGNRVWCRFGCPQAAILGILQKYLSRFRITVNGGQCISCGNCSAYCEMGIDVKAYAQRGQDIVRASCVGCGICSAVCPRGVLRLENGPVSTRKHEESRFGLTLTGDGVRLDP
jgi:formate hydrogenlyase subunit 6/NADH:ubiquinone oxidoreductase subunit I